MKSVLALCMLVLYTVSGMPTGDDDQEDGTGTISHGAFGGDSDTNQNISRISAALAPPAARRFGSADSPTSARCASACSQQFQRSVANDAPKGTALFDGETDYNPALMTVACSTYDTMKACLDACPNGEIKTALYKAAILAKFMCHDSTLKQNARCLHETLKTLQSSCGAPSKCGQYKEKLNEYTRNEPRDLAGMKDMMKQQCQHIKCRLDCSKPTIVTKCGQPAQNDLKGTFRKGVETIKYILELRGMSSTFPSECERFIAESA